MRTTGGCRTNWVGTMTGAACCAFWTIRALSRPTTALSRALRGAVIARKVSHCSKNEEGADAFSARNQDVGAQWRRPICGGSALRSSSAAIRFTPHHAEPPTPSANQLRSILPQDPHLVAFSFVIERFVTFLEQNRSTGRVIYEHRDPWRNAYLQWEYAHMHVSGTQYLRSSQFNKVLTSWVEFVPKKKRLVGLELADLIVGPTSRRVAAPDTAMIEWEAVKKTMWRGSNPSAPGQMGLKVFPGDLGKELLADSH